MIDLELVEAWLTTHKKSKAKVEHHVLIFPAGYEPKPGIQMMSYPEEPNEVQD